jgi:phosphotransferase system enzyme I (PtsI)
VVIRTLDAGSDKPLSFVEQAAETNPALGVRGYRTAVLRPELMDAQLLAIAKAAALESADVNVMAPMVTTVEEAAAFVSWCHDHGIAKAGVMIETPAAALLADRLLPLVDFVSIGTNDLTQYVMAADRLVGSLAALNDPWQPAVLQLIARVAQAGQEAGVPVGVCGEAAADPHLAAVLTGLGVTSLSMTSRAIPAVADQLAKVDHGRCRAAAVAAISAATAKQARSQVMGILGR